MKFEEYVKLIQDITVLSKKGWTFVKSDEKAIMYLHEGDEHHFTDLESMRAFVQDEVAQYYV